MAFGFIIRGGGTRKDKLPLKLPLISWIIVGVLIISAASVILYFRPKLKIKNVTSLRIGGFRAVIVLVSLLGLAFIFLVEALERLPIGRPGSRGFLTEGSRSAGTAAILRETTAYRVPDEESAVSTVFGEGQPVKVSSFGPDWCFAESNDGRSGWVKREAVITY